VPRSEQGHPGTTSPHPPPPTSDFPDTHATRYSLPDLGSRSTSVPTGGRHTTAPPTNLKPASSAQHRRFLSASRQPPPPPSFSSPILPEDQQTLIYHDPIRDAKIWQTPRIDADDRLIEQQLIEPARMSTGKTNRIRLSLGDINIEIESHDPVHVDSSPVPPVARLSPRVGGTAARRTGSGVIPSTPGSSPPKLKEESLRSGEEDIYGDTARINRELSPEFTEAEIQAAEDEEDDVILETEEMAIDEDLPVGPETQALFDADAEDDDLNLPNIEFESPAAKRWTPRKPRQESKFFDDPQAWITEKAQKYDVDAELVYWVLERTTGRPKLALKTLKYFQKENRMSLLTYPNTFCLTLFPFVRVVL